MRYLMIFMVAAVSAVQGWGANAPVLSALTSSQAAFQYNRPDTTVCVWEVSTSGTYSPLIADLHNQNDSGAQYRRWFILGQNTALTAATLYHWRQTCGAEIYTGQFTTLPAPTGTPSNQSTFSGGGHPYANKLKVEYGATPDLGSNVVVDCTPHCTATLTFAPDSILFYKFTYLNESDAVASGGVQVTTSR